MPLAPHDTSDRATVYLRLTDLASPRRAGQLAADERLLSAQERQARDRFVFPEDRLRYTVAHAELRRALSAHFGAPPERWRFHQTGAGRPELVPGQTETPVSFNLSHTRGLAACAVTGTADVGVDVEWQDRESRFEEIASRYYCPSEAADMAQGPPARQRERFFAYWTLKEAYLKALGVGLREPLDSVCFDIGPDGAIRARMSGDGRARGRWFFHLVRPTPSHVLALALPLPRDDGALPEVRLSWG